jgi:hypothetical protein
MSLKAAATSATSSSPSNRTRVDRSPAPTWRAAVTSRPSGAVSRADSSHATSAAAATATAVASSRRGPITGSRLRPRRLTWWTRSTPTKPRVGVSSGATAHARP